MKKETISLSEFTGLLEDSEGDEGRPVFFDFCNLQPTMLRSLHGRMNHLALGFTFPESDHSLSVGKLIDALRSALGSQFVTLEHGGFFTLARPETAVWVDNWPFVTWTPIVGVRHEDHQVIILTSSSLVVTLKRHQP